MGVFYQEERSHHSKRCMFLASLLKEAFSRCHSFNGGLSISGGDDEYSTSDIEDESEVPTLFYSSYMNLIARISVCLRCCLQVVVSEIRIRAMEKMKRRPRLMAESFTWVLYPSTGELYMSSKHAQRREDETEEEEFFSVGSCLSLCSSGASREAFMSAKSNFSRCSSLKQIDFPETWKLDLEDFRRRSIIREFCHCEGWPFGLCRKAVLLPPLPKSPSESWSWRKAARLAKTPYI
ncbi:hypothetical protein V6N13_039874 [Hibiscus sabdariffa]|uniref:Uncharacterized protein n=1 Tax=Hibiscus sabdariffa TaxID=183260 RepID=A0ABR2SUD8_9ROSI